MHRILLKLLARNAVWLPLALFVVMSIAVAWGGYRFHQHQRRVFVQSAQRELSSMADLKARHLAWWQHERMGDARAIQSNHATMRWLLAALQGRATDLAELTQWAGSLTNSFDYFDVLLLHTNGAVCVSSRANDRIGTYASSTLKRVLASGEIFISDLHRAEVVADVHLDVLIPVHDPDDRSAPPAGALMMRIDPFRMLFPLVQSWPVHSRSAETLLVRAEGHDVVYLNELRHRTNTALRLRYAASVAHSPAAMAVRGVRGIVSAVDYRGVRVVADIDDVPATPWLLISKVDEDELYAPLQRQLGMVVLAVDALIICAGALIMLAWQRIMARMRHERAHAATERQALVQHFDYLTRYANDIILLARDDYRIVDANERALAVYGYTRHELLQMRVSDLRTEAARAAFDAQMHDVMAAGGAIFETAHRTKAGRVFPVEVSTRLIAIKQQRFFQAIVRDVTERIQAQQSLADAKRFLDNVFDSIQDGICVLDPQLVIVRTNRAMERWFAHAMPLVGKRSHDIYHTTHADQSMWPAARALSARAAAYQLVPRIGPRGEFTGWLDLYAFPLLDHDGSVHGVIEYVRDVTERKRAEEQLGRTNRMYVVLSNINEAIVRTRDRAALLRAACGIAVKDGGFAAAWIGLRDGSSDRLHLAAAAGLPAESLAPVVSYAFSDDDAAATPCNIALRHGRHFICNDLPADTSGNGCLTLLRQHGVGSCAVFPLCTAGAVTGVFAFCAGEPKFFSIAEVALLTELADDISFALEAAQMDDQRRAAEDALRHAQQRLLEAQRIAQVGDWNYEISSGHITLSEQAARNLGRAPGATFCTRSEFLQHFRADDARLLHDALASAISAAQAFELELQTAHDDAAALTLAVRGQALCGPDGTVARLYGSLQDITARVRADREHDQLRAALTQAQKMEAIGTLAGGVAHDFNNILTTILGYTDLALLSVSEDMPLFSELQQVRNAAQRAAALTRQLLLFSRRQHVQRTALNVATLVNGVLSMLRRIIGEHIEIVTECAADAWHVRGDASSIEQVLMNLVVNSRDAMPHGGRITISVHNASISDSTAADNPGARPGTYVAVRVADTGTGITPDVRARMFEPFFTTKDVGKGTGLGLAVVYGIVQQHDGWISVESAPGAGAAFTIYLPAATEPADDPARTPASSNALRGNGEHVLLVEDDAAVRRFVCAALRNYGYHVTEAATAAEAHALCTQDHAAFALLFSDVVLPDQNGVDLADQLRAAMPGVQVVLSSGYTDLRAQWSGKTNPAYLFIQKPFQVPQLLEIVRRALAASSSPSA